MKKLVTGQRIKLDELTPDHFIKVGITLSFAKSIVVDISCFGVDAQNQLSDDRYMIFYNQKQSPCGALSIISDTTLNSQIFQVDLKKLPQNIQKLVFTATIDGAETMEALRYGEIGIFDNTGAAGEFKFDNTNLNQEKALIIAELYLKGQWRFAAVAQGFNEGLSALLKHFGGQEVLEKPPPLLPAAKINLSKVTLKKKGDKKSISLEKADKNFIHVNLNWDAPEPKKFHFLVQMQHLIWIWAVCSASKMERWASSSHWATVLAAAINHHIFFWTKMIVAAPAPQVKI